MSRMSAVRLAGVACAVLASCSAGWAGPVRIVSQNRFVDAIADEPGPRRQEQRADASDFGPFNHTVQVTTPGGAGLAVQDSVLALSPGGALFTATGSVTGNVTIAVGGESKFDVTFSVSEALPYRLAFVGDSRAGVPPPTFSFTGPTGGGPFPGPEETLSGILPPGTYRFTADASEPNSGFFVNFSMGSAVPLPPALWGSLATLPLLLLGRRQLRLREVHTA